MDADVHAQVPRHYLMDTAECVIGNPDAGGAAKAVQPGAAPCAKGPTPKLAFFCSASRRSAALPGPAGCGAFWLLLPPWLLAKGAQLSLSLSLSLSESEREPSKREPGELSKPQVARLGF